MRIRLTFLIQRADGAGVDSGEESDKNRGHGAELMPGFASLPASRDG